VTSQLKTKLYADHNQIHLLDEAEPPSFEDAWTTEATEDCLAVAKGGIAIGTKESDDVVVTVELLKAEPKKLEPGDRINEASIAVSSGKLVVMGCADYFPKAKRVALAKGTYRARISHAGLLRGKEKIAIQLWPAKAAKPKVVQRWVPPPPKPSPWIGGKPPRTARKAAECVRAGQLALALPVLEKLADQGDVEASLSLAQLAAFRRDDVGVVRRAVALFEKPDTIGSINAFDQMGGILRAALLRTETKAEAERRIAALANKMKGALREGDSDGSNELAPPEHDAQKRYDDWVEGAKSRPDFVKRPAAFLHHRFQIACNSRLEREVLRLWAEPTMPRRWADAVFVARWLAHRGKPEEAWRTLEAHVASWWQLYYFDVVPMELVTDVTLTKLLTPERAEKILATPRGDQAGE
jgi:hypothetical protein